MPGLFTTDFFIQNRAKLRAAVTADAPIVVTANGVLQRNSDNTYPFKQDANFWYLTGVNEPDVVLVMDQSGEYLITPTRSEIHGRFEGVIDPEVLRKTSGIADVYDLNDGWRRLRASVKQAGKVATLQSAPAYISSWGMYTNPARRRLIQRLKNISSGLEIIDIRTTMARLRQVKQQPELAAIQEAVDITVETLQNVFDPRSWPAYEYEYQVTADLVAGYLKAGADGESFGAIVSGGIRACTFHNSSNRNKLSPDEIVVIDTGAEVQQYAADISRTVAVARPTDRQQAVFDAVLDAQEFALGLLQPGISYKEWDKQWRAYIGKKLIGLKLITKADDASIARYYPHYSHFLGLDVHDAGDYERPFEPGMVLTCEPGIYIPEEAIGVRIEDDILITETGHTVLSSKLPRKLTV